MMIWLEILLCMTLCTATWGGFYMGLHRRGIGYIRGFGWTTAYFTAAGGLLTGLFWPHLAPFFENYSSAPLFLFAPFMFALLLLSWYVPRHMPEPSAYFARYPDRYFLQIDWRRVISKSADIASQQIFIMALIALLHEAGLPLFELTVVFLVLFALLHIPLLASEWGKWPSFLFGGAVLSFGLTFPSLILLVPYGFVYTFMIHWTFYLVTAVAFWVRSARLSMQRSTA